MSHFSNFMAERPPILFKIQKFMRRIFVLVFVIFMVACTPSKTNKISGSLDKFKLTHWLIGSWHSQSQDALYYESWGQTNDSTLSGRSYSITNGDTVSSEFITLIQRKGQLTYIPTVPGQNQGLPVEFELTHITNKEMIFENAGHDFPQVISYKQLSADSLIAEIAGTIDGNRRAIQFPMRRLN